MHWLEHYRKWINCQRCVLSKTRKHVVLARGVIPSSVVFVGEAPGESEDVLGIPFVGPAGKLLDQLIDGLVKRCAFTNVVGCIPLDIHNEKTIPTEPCIEECLPRLLEFLSIAKPKALVAVGEIALTVLHRIKTHLPIYKILHPAAILRLTAGQRPLAIQRNITTLQKMVMEQFSTE